MEFFPISAMLTCQGCAFRPLFTPRNQMPYLTGQKLKDELEKPAIGCSPKIEDFAFDDTVMMFTSQPGIGKSVVTTNMAASTSTASKVFGFLKSHREYKSAYLQMEGSRDEQLSRLKCIEEIVPVNYDNISWHTTPVIAENQQTWTPLLKELAEVAPFDFLYIDPIYKATMYGLKKEESALALIKLIDTIRAEFRPTIILNNHETKETYTNKGDRIEKDDPFYGSQWLKAYVDVSFNIRAHDKNQISITQKKDRTNNVLKQFILNFDPANFHLKFDQAGSDMPARYKVQIFLNKKFTVNAFTVTNEISRETGLSKRHILRMKADGYFDDIATFFEGERKELTWSRKL